ncbi:unnamed protein product [Malus baccata var. baccata]
MPERNVVTWNLLYKMKAGDIKPLYLTVTGALSACVHLGYHSKQQASSPHVITALIDMYAKCGSMHNSLEVSYKSKNKDIYCWTALISGLALHGFGYAVLKLFNQMRENCIKPDDITFIGVLSACSHAGLVEEGCEIFQAEPGSLTRHCNSSKGCRFEPGKSVLGALLSACAIH